MPVSSGNLNLAHLACPVCKQTGQLSSLLLHDSHSLACSVCHTSFPISKGVPILLVDTTLESRLEKNPDAEIHKLSDVAIENTYIEWSALLSEFGSSAGAYLEIGSGIGRLSHGIIRHSAYSDICITDLSDVFIQNIIERTSTVRDNLHFYVCDANHLPFQHNTFDVIVGRSILHHILHYEKTLEEAFNVLKPRGKAFFLEPVLQGKLQVAFFLKVMMAIHAKQQMTVYTPVQINKINVLIRHLTKAHRTGNDIETLRKMEDKYIFDIEAIKELSARIGFKTFHYRNNISSRTDKGNAFPVWGYGNHVHSHIRKFGVSLEQLGKFDYLFTCFGETFSDHINHQLYTPMGHFIFEK